MAENTFETQYDLTKKNKIVKFYEDNKILIYSSLITLLIIFGSVTFYFENKENNKILLSENYIQAKINLESGKKNEAISDLKELIFSNDPTYSTLSLYLILDHNLIKNEKVQKSIDRNDVWLSATPQVFCLEDLLSALTKANEEEKVFTDEVSAMLHYYKKDISIYPCNKTNIKVTKKEDLETVEQYLKLAGRI